MRTSSNCLTLKNALSSSGISILECDTKEKRIESYNFYDYIFEYEGNDRDISLNRIRYYDSDLQDYYTGDFEIDTVKYSYFLPITLKEQQVQIIIPDEVSILFLELGNQEIDFTVPLKLNISYQDLAGKEYDECFIIEVSFDQLIKNNGEYTCTFNISTHTEQE